MSSPFSAEIIPLPSARAKQEPGDPPRRVPAFKGRPVLDIGEMAQATRDAGMQSAVREIEARLNGAARHVVIEPFAPTRRINLSAVAIFLLTWGVIGGCYLLLASGRL